MDVQTAVITGYGINADYELEEAFRRAGSRAHRIHVEDLIERPEVLDDLHILAFPGGFSFGDHLGSGLVFAHLCKRHLINPLREFVASGKLVIGICNGFQVLVKMGLLPDLGGRGEQEVSLIHNDTGVFVDEWVRVEFESSSRCIWTKGLEDIDLPIRHGEGRFVTKSEDVRSSLGEKGLVALRYKGKNPNGSVDNIAGITDTSGRVLGLMPHPEAYLSHENHPRWQRFQDTGDNGLVIFEKGVDYIRDSF